MRGDFFLNDGDIEENEADTRTFVDTLIRQDGWFKGLMVQTLSHRQCTSWQYSVGYRQRVRFAQAVAAVGTVVVPGAQPRAIMQKGPLFDTFDSIGCPQENCLQWKDGVKVWAERKAYCAYCAGPEGIRDNYFDRLASGDDRFDSLQECPPEKCLQWKTRHGKSGTKAYCVYCAGDGSSLPEGFRRL